VCACVHFLFLSTSSVGVLMKSKCAVSHGSSWTANFCDEGGHGLILF
jgi:hypothetical protein